MTDAWGTGQSYEPYVGRWSRLVARSFLNWLGMPCAARWVDVGCGTGALTETVLALASPARILGVDASESYVGFARQQVVGDRVRFEVADARALPCQDSSFDVAVSGLVLNFLPEPSTMASEMVRVVRPGGTVAAYVWDYSGEMQLMRCFWDAASALDAVAAELDEGRRFPICNPDALVRLWRECELDCVESRAIDVPTHFRDFDDYWQPFLGGQGPAPGYVATLDPDRRVALRERLRSTLPRARQGHIELTARAWAVRGTKRG
ncbi:MAG: class I SAM-dependent methyltransferase [Deltaproteobacteria bacterium]|nr:class I SAM-dependent methyltransferase [Deltaproteobacteria bacterium]